MKPIPMKSVIPADVSNENTSLNITGEYEEAKPPKKMPTRRGKQVQSITSSLNASAISIKPPVTVTETE